MKKVLQLSLFVFLFFNVFSQENWKWVEAASLPIATANNSVSEATINNNKFVYSFGGISDSLHFSTIHQRVFKYDVSANLWSEQESIPDTLGKIGSAVSFVKNKLYLIGGKYVLPNTTEISSKNVYVFNPFLDTFEINGSPLPIPVHDHVQSVWRDSLIYVISGLSHNQTVPNVQIYNPFFDAWTAGTPVPNTSQYKSFGASGYILADTIYYYGGANQYSNSQAVNYFRKGVINPDDPTQISWSLPVVDFGAPLFGGACSGHNTTFFCVGGTQKAHTYDALEYNTNVPVFANHRILEHDIKKNNYSNTYNAPFHVMALKGIAKLGGGNWMVVGGIDPLQQASDKVFLVHNINLSDFEKATAPPFFKVNEADDHYIIVTENIGQVVIYDIAGKTLYKSQKKLSDLYISKSQLTKGILLFVYKDEVNLPVHIKKVNP